MTEKLYYQDSHIWEFTATVLTCGEAAQGYVLELDRTAFFPEGGGQLADNGFIGSARVRDVQEKNGHILHYTDTDLPVGETLQCRLDRETRYRRMQNHSGEHIVSGLVHKHFGYDNVGFHMGEECMTIDFSGELDWDALQQIEQEANCVVREDLPFHVYFPDGETLKTLEYRSKLELTENVRIVEIPGVDACACCAPHVYRSGEVGMIKILDCMRHRGGVRVSLVCGMDALEVFRLYQKNVTAVSNAISVKRQATGEGVERVLREKAQLNERLGALSAELAKLKAQVTAETDGNLCVIENTLNEAGRRELCNLLMEKCCIAAVFSGSDTEGYRYIIGSKKVNLRQNAKAINAGISGRGGGSPEMLQGSAAATAEELQKFIINLEF